MCLWSRLALFYPYAERSDTRQGCFPHVLYNFKLVLAFIGKFVV
jgi:hypothetical protein